jgi:hypothetical protein
VIEGVAQQVKGDEDDNPAKHECPCVRVYPMVDVLFFVTPGHAQERTQGACNDVRGEVLYG